MTSFIAYTRVLGIVPVNIDPPVMIELREACAGLAGLQMVLTGRFCIFSPDTKP